MADKKRTNPTVRAFQIFLARLVLEVFGGGGAIWGFSEALTLRNPETQEFWRKVASVVAALFAIRFFLQIRDYINECNGISNNLDKDRSLVRLVQVFSARLVLEVFGGAGAIWGFTESMSLRRPDTQEFWRFWALFIGLLFFIRFILQTQDFLRGPSPDLEKKNWTRFLHIFSARIVLEVFGGAGAIWGFSEVCTLRRPETQEFWRFNALTIGLIFMIRFLMQQKDFFLEIKLSDGSVAMTDQKWVRLLQIFSAKLVLEFFGGAGAIWGFSEASTLRRPETQEFWRFNALVIGAIFFLRMMCQVRDYVYEIKEEDLRNPSNPSKPQLIPTATKGENTPLMA